MKPGEQTVGDAERAEHELARCKLIGAPLRGYLAAWQRARAAAAAVARRDSDARIERLGLWAGGLGGLGGFPTPVEVEAWLAADADGIHVRPGEDPAGARRRHRDPIGERIREQQRAFVTGSWADHARRRVLGVWRRP